MISVIRNTTKFWIPENTESYQFSNKIEKAKIFYLTTKIVIYS